MIAFFRKRVRRGFSLIELMVTLGVMSVVMVGAFQIFQEGMQLFRTNRAAADAQASALKVMGRVGVEVVNAKASVAQHYPAGAGVPPGIVFASPLDDDGNSRFDPITGELYWQKYICFFYEPNDATTTKGKVYRVTEPIPPENAAGTGHTDIFGVVAPGVAARTTTYFQVSAGLDRRLLGDDISGFNVEVYAGDIGGAGAAEITSYNVTVEAGDKDQASSTGYYIKVESKVTPRG